MRLIGINGDRAEAIERVLRGSSARMTADEIVDALRANDDDDLIRTVGATETVQAVLRAMEAVGLVDRVRGRRLIPGRVYDDWGLTA